MVYILLKEKQKLVLCFESRFPGGSVVKNLPANVGDLRDMGLIPGSERFLWRRAWQCTPVFFPGEPHSLAGYGPWGCKV